MKKTIKLLLLILTLVITALLFTGCGGEAELEYDLQSDDTYKVYINDRSAGKVIIPDTYNGKPVTRLEYCYSYYPANATEISLPDSLNYVNGRALLGLTNLCEYEGGVTYVGNWAVACDPNKAEVTVREGTVGIARGFVDVNDGSILTKLTLPGSVRKISMMSICAPKLEILNLGDGVDYIGDQAFCYCRSLKEIIIPEGVEEIRKDTFFDCPSLTRVVLPKSLKVIHNYAFTAKNGGYHQVNIYYAGTEYERGLITEDRTSGGSSIFTYHTWRYYSEKFPVSSLNKYWFYLDGHPVAWSQY